MPEIAGMDLDKPFEACGLSKLLMDATIVYQGQLTPKFRYLEKHLG
jgi:hypothetical protein